jgi:regulator of extracellular matrix RemA (YlzA/DUF370 family)
MNPEVTNAPADQIVDELRQLGEELRALFGHERRAIAKLDHVQLAQLATMKRTVADRLAEVRRAAPASLPRELRDLFAAIQAEARANQMLANTAAEAVRALLGYEAPNGYDRRARQTAHRPMHALITY